jgi:putative PIN family toxin of toxin-antitoxin system
MLRVVLDTNVIVSGIISPHGPSRQILEAWHQQRFELLVSEALVLEISRVLRYPRLQKIYRLSEADIEVVLASLLNDAYLLEDLYEVQRSRDPDDNILLACALEGKAAYVVSGDSDLLEIKYYHGTQIVSPRQLLDILNTL